MGAAPKLDPKRSLARRCPACGVSYRASRQTCARDGVPLVDVPRDPLLGTVLGETYRIDRPLGRGGMGALYVATHLRVERPVAVKVLHAAFADHDLALARFYREARAMARIRSPYVVQVLDALRTEDGRPCLVVELVDGEDLQARLRGGRLEPDEALEIAEQLCRGLEAAHAAGVVHRDLKPSNVLIDAAGVAKVVDFGVAHLDGDAQLTQSGTVVGTPAYMAPEQVRGSATVDARADVYGLGAVMYCALTGRAPYEGTAPTEILSQVLDSSPPPPRTLRPDLPADVESWLMRAMSRDPATRFESAREMGEAARRLRMRRAAPLPWSSGTRARAVGCALGLAGLVGLSLTHQWGVSPWVALMSAVAVGAGLVRRGLGVDRPGPWALAPFAAGLGLTLAVGLLALLGVEAPWLAAVGALLGWLVGRHRAPLAPPLSEAARTR